VGSGGRADGRRQCAVEEEEEQQAEEEKVVKDADLAAEEPVAAKQDKSVDELADALGKTEIK